MSSRQQIDSVIDDDDEFWYVEVSGLSARFRLLTRIEAPFVLKNSISQTRTSSLVPVDTRYAFSFMLVFATTGKSVVVFVLTCDPVSRFVNSVTTISKPTAKRVDAPTADGLTMIAPFNTRSPMQKSQSTDPHRCPHAHPQPH